MGFNDVKERSVFTFLYLFAVVGIVSHFHNFVLFFFCHERLMNDVVPVSIQSIRCSACLRQRSCPSHISIPCCFQCSTAPPPGCFGGPSASFLSVFLAAYSFKWLSQDFSVSFFSRHGQKNLAEVFVSYL